MTSRIGKDQVAYCYHQNDQYCQIDRTDLTDQTDPIDPTEPNDLTERTLAERSRIAPAPATAFLKLADRLTGGSVPLSALTGPSLAPPPLPLPPTPTPRQPSTSHRLSLP